ncbi:4484_t:CDS:2, partial [Diversispora eburnea]
MPTNQKTKNSRGKRIQTSTTLQFAPPNWFLKLFRKGSNNLMSFPRESNFNFPWGSNLFPNRIISKISSLPFIFPKLLFIFLCAGMGAAIPFLPIFYSSSLNLSSTQIGIVFSIAPFVSAISCPLWTGLADRFHSHRLIIVTIYSLATLGVISQMILPKIINIDNNSLKMFCVLFAALWFAFFGIPVNALVDSGVIKILGDKRELYGQQRLWGSIAYGASTLGVGLLWSITNNINVVFYFFFGTALSFTISTLFTDFNSNEDIEEFLIRPPKDTTFKSLIDLEDFDNVGESNILAFAPTSPNLATASLAANPMAALKTLFSNTSVATLLIVMLLMGTALSMCNSFLLLFLSQELKANSTILGLTGVMTALYAGIGTGFGSLIGGLLYDSAGGPKAMFGGVVAISILSLAMYWWGEGGFNINIDHFGGKRRQRDTKSPWEGINEAHTNSTRRGVLSVETARTKKGRYE